MDAQLKQKWIQALKSGEYQQGQQVLCSDDDRFCCLGVLAKVAGADYEPSHGSKVPFLDGNPVFDRNKDGSPTGYLRDGGFGLSQKQQEALIDLNDGGSAFPRIADYIESNIPSDGPSLPSHIRAPESDAQSLETREVQS